ncbi:Transmembrane protein [Parasponia andersonii]|uniref:Transmembrane protein n=1 Tax=Parasponia andersonii TaxID=3476 RepID=A0A2P5BU65_PARAD|nr:Transmembrane protein [Parasponia andersonii]
MDYSAVEVLDSDSSIAENFLTSRAFNLHNAANIGDKQIIQEILDSNPLLAFETNVEGDTPLHVAARLGRLDVAKLLVDKFCGNGEGSVLVDHEGGNKKKELLRMTNNEKSTAVHEAVKNGQYEIVKFLIREDSSLVSSINDDGESPLFMAVDRELYEIANCILSNIDYVKGDRCYTSWSGRNGMTAMHAAVIRKQDST